MPFLSLSLAYTAHWYLSPKNAHRIFANDKLVKDEWRPVPNSRQIVSTKHVKSFASAKQTLCEKQFDCALMQCDPKSLNMFLIRNNSVVDVFWSNSKASRMQCLMNAEEWWDDWSTDALDVDTYWDSV